MHRRVIVRGYGKPVYKASSRSALLAALEGCIKRHESLRKAGFLHRDISINNLMINEDDNHSWSSFLTDLDLAIKEQRDGTLGAGAKTGTRAFMAVGALLGEQHSFMHHLESFFWVLFWTCSHYHAGRAVDRTLFDGWHSQGDKALAMSKIGTIAHDSNFLELAGETFTENYQPLIPTVNALRRRVFPNNQRWKVPDPSLHSDMEEILRRGWENLGAEDAR